MVYYDNKSIPLYFRCKYHNLKNNKMDLKLERGDLLQLDAISNCGTLKLFPPGKKLKQKLVVGDDSGTVGCYEFKKGEPQTVFTHKPFEGPISSLAIGGTYQKRDKIYVSHDQKIVGKYL